MLLQKMSAGAVGRSEAASTAGPVLSATSLLSAQDPLEAGVEDTAGLFLFWVWCCWVLGVEEVRCGRLVLLRLASCVLRLAFACLRVVCWVVESDGM